jgi:hypothetical protein
MTSRALLESLCVAAALVLAPAGASAAPYAVDVCRNLDTGAPAATLAGVGVVGGGLANSCGDPDPAVGLASQIAHGLMTPQSTTSIHLDVPATFANVRIARVQSWYAALASSGSPGFLSMVASNGTVFVVRPTDTPQAPMDDFPMPAGTRGLKWEVYCSNNPANCQFGDGNQLNVLTVLRVRLTLDEDVNPTLAITGGGLTGTGAKSGQQSLTFDAADADSGVAAVSAALDGTVVGASASRCEGRDWAVCPRDRVGQVLQADTTKVPDGNHELLVTARDAAGNALTRSLGVVAVDNGGVSVPNGANPSRLAKITARFTTTKRRSRTLRLTSTPTVRGALVDESGKPIAGATVAVLARLKQAGASATQVTTARTGDDGGFSLKLPGGPSRTITFAYTAFSGDAKPASTATLRTTVRAILSARVAPRSARPGGRITLTGRLRLLPRRGLQITIQARQGRTWRTIDAVRTTRTGAFAWHYRFAAIQARRTYAFRARVASPIYPFAAASSGAALVRVR